MGQQLSNFEVAPTGLGDLATASDKAIGATTLHLIDSIPTLHDGVRDHKFTIDSHYIDDRLYDFSNVGTRYPFADAEQVVSLLPGFPDHDIEHVIIRRQELEWRGEKSPEEPFYLRGDAVGSIALVLANNSEQDGGKTRFGIHTTGSVLLPSRSEHDYRKADVIAIKESNYKSTVRQRYIDRYRGALVVADTVAAAGEAYGITSPSREELVELFGEWSAQPVSLQTPETPNAPTDNYVLAWSRERVPQLAY